MHINLRNKTRHSTRAKFYKTIAITTLNYNLDKLEILERRIIRKILGPRKTSESWKLRSNDEIYQKYRKYNRNNKKKKTIIFWTFI